jgi:CheY-like chemotaxis protein
LQKKFRALVVDDNEDGAAMLATVLRLMGHEPTVVTDSREALKAALATKPDVAFVDIAMPHLNGYNLAVELRRHFPRDKLCIVAVTGHADEASRRASTKAGIDVHLAKPVDPKMLEYTIEIVCKQIAPE